MMLHGATEEGEARLSAVGTTPASAKERCAAALRHPTGDRGGGLTEVWICRPQSKKPFREIFSSPYCGAPRAASLPHRRNVGVACSQKPYCGTRSRLEIERGSDVTVGLNPTPSD
jgi:hypothetical protein